MRISIAFGSERLAATAVLLCPLFLLHGRVVAEALMAAIGLLFLVRSGVDRDWRWLGSAWVRLAALWWAWLVVCSLQGGLVQALLVIRYLLFVAALEAWVLRPAWRRLWLARLAALAALYIALQTGLQLLAGRNLQGYGRWGDGELTGPFEHPRAAAPLSRLLFPALMQAGLGWGGVAAAVAGMAVMVLIGQRMPLLLTGLGLLTTALLLPGARPAVLLAAGAAATLLAASAFIEPPTFYRLVTKFSAQMAEFPDSPYGQIAARAVAMVRAHPLFGLGFDGFRRACADPAYFTGWHGDDGGAAAICVQHPHNHYLQAAVEAGVPGLALFVALVAAWLARLAHGLRGAERGGAAPLRAGLFAAALIHLWPLASASAFTSMPLSGWFFLLLGLGLAEARAYIGASHDRGRPCPTPPPTPSSPSPS